MILDDGVVIPSYLSVQSRGHSLPSMGMLNDIVLRLGEVKHVIWPDDPKSYGKTTVEYEVEVQHREGNGIYNTTVFRGCTASNMFGGKADKFLSTFRADSNPSGTDRNVGTGSKVILLCLNGDQQKAIILGGVGEPTDRQVPSSEDGHHLSFQFNGIHFTIDKDGQATMTFHGATNTDGSLADTADTNAEGTQIAITQDGNVTVATPDEAQFVRVNHHDHKIEIQSDQEFALASNGVVNVDARGDVNITSTGVKVGDATDAWVKGTTYRTAEQALHSQIVTSLGILSGLLTAAGTNLSAFPTTAGAGAALTSAVGVITSMIGGIQTFESQAQTFLSVKNKSD